MSLYLLTNYERMSKIIMSINMSFYVIDSKSYNLRHKGAIVKKKILFLIHDLNCGGAERVLVNLVNNLDQEKYDITVQTLFDVGILRDKLGSNIHYIAGFKKMFRGNVTLSKLLTPKQLCKMLIKDDYDIAIAYLEGQCCRIISAYEGKKIAWIHTFFRNEQEAVQSFKAMDEAKACYSKFDKIVCVSKTVEEQFNSFFDLSSKSEVIYNAIDVDNILNKSKQHQDLICSNDAIANIVASGKLCNEIKGFDRLIRVHKKLLNDNIENKLYIIGDGEDRANLEALIDELGVSETVSLMGFVENPFNYVANSDLFVCSSHREGYSTAVTEALILGVPVISTEVSGAKELINNGCGTVCDNNEEALYNAVKQVLTNKNLLAEYKQNAEQRSKQISPEQSIEKFENLINY